MKRISPAMLVVGLMLVAAGVLIPITTNDVASPTFRYIFAAGAALTFLARLFGPTPPEGTPLKVKRLLRLESWSSLLFCVAAFFAFYSAPQLRDWLAFTLAGAALQVYCSIALALVGRKSRR